ncbi:unnamed protein product [Mycena citricolor]|uniref:Uncharacterized protein n=1 Tax=Mycena citricolor TaxID=2018698 RepID=A0AAD2HIG2_9AGAR|nr:unnamed protein product [Mycena citricolor]
MRLYRQRNARLVQPGTGAAPQPVPQPTRQRSRTKAPAATNIMAAADWFRKNATSFTNAAIVLTAQRRPENPSGWTEEQELDNFLAAPLSDKTTSDMIGFWTVHSRCFKFLHAANLRQNYGHTIWPTIHLLFLDYVPIPPWTPHICTSRGTFFRIRSTGWAAQREDFHHPEEDLVC